jgi:hypothetical protein
MNMAARLPINPLPFENDTEIHEFELPNGETANMTKRQFFDIAMGDLYEKANTLAASKASEAVARTRVRDLLFPDSWDSEGTDKFQLPGGWVLEFKRTLNVKIDDAALPAIKEAIEKLPVDADSGEMASMDAISYKPDLSMSKYREMRDDAKKLLGEALTFTPGSPAIKTIEPSAKATVKATDQKARAAS